MQNVFIYGFLKQRRDVQYAFGFIDLFFNPDGIKNKYQAKRLVFPSSVSKLILQDLNAISLKDKPPSKLQCNPTTILNAIMH